MISHNDNLKKKLKKNIDTLHTNTYLMVCMEMCTENKWEKERGRDGWNGCSQ